MIVELLTLISLSVSGFVLFLYRNYYNDVYKRFQVILKSHKLSNTPEVQDPIVLQVQSGQIPSWLNGIMYRIGPGRFNIQQDDGSTFSIRHAFDGLPFMHRFEVNGSTQTLKYNSRMLAKSLETKIKSKTSKGLIFFGHIPEMTFPEWLYNFYVRFNNLILFPKARDNAGPDGQAVGVTVTPNFPLPAKIRKTDNENVLVSKTDANVLQKIHAETLEPQNIFTYTSYDARVKGQLSAAHHQYDHNTKEIFNFALTTGPVPRLVVFSTSEAGKVTILADFTHRTDKSSIQAPYIHSLWLTENYVIIPESPMVLKDRGANMLMNGSFLSSISWVKDAPTYCHVISRHPAQEKEGLVASIPVNPGFFTFHVGNAFETKNESGETILTLDAASFWDGDIMHQLHGFGTPHRKGFVAEKVKQSTLNGISYPPRQQSGFGDLVRYKLNLDQSTTLSIDTLAKNVEFPRFNQDYALKEESRFVYGCQLQGFTEKRDETGGLIKVDLTGQTEPLTFVEEGFNCSEPIFVPNPTGTKEDDGVLLSLVNNFDCCYFIVFDASNLEELARIKIGQFIAVTFHGSYVDHEFKSININ
ncbi:carotenoid cleavage dioxygenase 1 [Mucor ambiguus]|uniref:Carotenoid cleavage dioxygenase 1 n=1 Tax=Mucor ambiguus TaxID=91626 RepID=A0A0C9MVC4_9FUNG|nr:carotenoid cleavage dioxygenase 1 [Mucor ambiguus]